MNKIQRYFRHRQHLIEQYIQGDMTKGEYLKENLRAVLSLDIEPFRNLDTVEKALFNYQYFNAIAKENMRLAKAAKDYHTRKVYEKDAAYEYDMKDKATSRVVQLLDYRYMTAYFIRVRSQLLKGRLFEIVLEESRDNPVGGIVLHSANERILQKLREEGVFTEERRYSVIDHYINQKY